MKMRYSGMALMLLAALTLGGAAHAKDISVGWNLLGNEQSQPLTVSTVFSDSNSFTTVWTWDAINSAWNFYSAMMTSIALQTYAGNKGYGVLSAIQAGDGYWVNAKVATTLPASAATAPAKNISVGWNLLGNQQGQPLTVSTVFSDSNSFTTVWTWDAINSAWNFYSPMMTATELQTYASSKAYGVQSVVQPGDGYWVNANVATGGSVPKITSDTCKTPSYGGCLSSKIYYSNGWPSGIRYYFYLKNIGGAGMIDITVSAGGYTENKQFAVDAGARYTLQSIIPGSFWPAVSSDKSYITASSPGFSKTIIDSPTSFLYPSSLAGLQKLVPNAAPSSSLVVE